MAVILHARSRRKATEKLKVPKQSDPLYMNIAHEDELEWAIRYAVNFLDAGMMKRRVSVNEYCEKRKKGPNQSAQ